MTRYFGKCVGSEKVKVLFEFFPFLFSAKLKAHLSAELVGENV
jgi:hypothetical protein